MANVATCFLPLILDPAVTRKMRYIYRISAWKSVELRGSVYDCRDSAITYELTDMCTNGLTAADTWTERTQNRTN